MGYDTYTDMESRERLEALLDARDAAAPCERCQRELPYALRGGYWGNDRILCQCCLADLGGEEV